MKFASILVLFVVGTGTVLGQTPAKPMVAAPSTSTAPAPPKPTVLPGISLELQVQIFRAQRDAQSAQNNANALTLDYNKKIAQAQDAYNQAVTKLGDLSAQAFKAANLSDKAY